jgi:hypothetical protein
MRRNALFMAGLAAALTVAGRAVSCAGAQGLASRAPAQLLASRSARFLATVRFRLIREHSRCLTSAAFASPA